MEHPELDSLWRSKRTGNIWKVLNIARNADTLGYLVVGKLVIGGLIWCYPVSSWFDEFERIDQPHIAAAVDGVYAVSAQGTRFFVPCVAQDTSDGTHTFAELYWTIFELQKARSTSSDLIDSGD